MSISPDIAERSRAYSPIDVGTRYFTLISKPWSASVITQAAALVKLCRANGYDPEVLGNALLARPDRITRLTRTANVHHLRYRPDLEPITEEATKDMIDGDFYWAKKMMVIDDADLDEIFDRYTVAKHSSSIREIRIRRRMAFNTWAREYVLDKIAEKETQATANL